MTTIDTSDAVLRMAEQALAKDRELTTVRAQLAAAERKNANLIAVWSASILAPATSTQPSTAQLSAADEAALDRELAQLFGFDSQPPARLAAPASEEEALFRELDVIFKGALSAGGGR